MKTLAEYREEFIRQRMAKAEADARRAGDDTVLTEVLDRMVAARVRWLKEVGTHTQSGGVWGPVEQWTVTYKGGEMTYWENFNSPSYEARLRVGERTYTFDPRGRPYNQIYHKDPQVRGQLMLEAIGLLEEIPVLLVDMV